MSTTKLDPTHEETRNYLDLKFGIEDVSTRERLITVGGAWSHAHTRYVDLAAREHVVAVWPQQIVAAREACGWLAHYQELMDEAQNEQSVPVAVFRGRRRSGKSHLACMIQVAFAVMVPGTVSWTLAPDQQGADELHAMLKALVPGTWRDWKEDAGLILANGSRIDIHTSIESVPAATRAKGVALCDDAERMSTHDTMRLHALLGETAVLLIQTEGPIARTSQPWDVRRAR